jgi:glycosyltransferase involved in cell wall biosynthesis
MTDFTDESSSNAVPGSIPEGDGPDVSVVVPVRNREDLLPGLLGALDRQTLDGRRFEVIIVDDCSVDRTKAIVQAWVDSDPLRRHLVVSEGKGPGHARNRGLSLSTAEWIAFTDSDTLPEPDWLEAGLRSVERLGAVAVEGSVEPWPPDAIGPQTHQVINTTGGLYMTANMIYRREVLDELGGFDERFYQPFLEDSDLAFRLMDSGYDIPFAPEVRVRHHVIQPSFSSIFRSTRHQRWLSLFAVKHPDRYWTQLRPAVRPLSSVDVDVILALFSILALSRTRGPGRAVLFAVAAHGFKSGLASNGVFHGPLDQSGSRAVLALGLPVARAFWWLEGCIHFRKFVW